MATTKYVDLNGLSRFKTNLDEEINGLVATLTTNLAPTYSSSSTYSVGDYVIYNNVLYVCNTAISTAEVWNSSHWTQTSIATVIGNIASALNTINSGGGVS